MGFGLLCFSLMGAPRRQISRSGKTLYTNCFETGYWFTHTRLKTQKIYDQRGMFNSHRLCFWNHPVWTKGTNKFLLGLSSDEGQLSALTKVSFQLQRSNLDKKALCIKSFIFRHNVFWILFYLFNDGDSMNSWSPSSSISPCMRYCTFARWYDFDSPVNIVQIPNTDLLLAAK